MRDHWLPRAKRLMPTSHFPAAGGIPRYSCIRGRLPAWGKTGWLQQKCLLSLLSHVVLEHPAASQDEGINPQICPQIPRSAQNDPDLVLREVRPGGRGKVAGNSIFFCSE